MVQADSAGELPNFEVRYYLSPYVKNPDFKSKENVDKVQHFFEVPPQYREDGTGMSDTFVITRDLKKPITYYISANTPRGIYSNCKRGR